MALFTITYRPETGLPAETVDADGVRTEAGGQVVLRRSVLVVGQPREVVVRRLAGAQVLRVEPA